MSRIGKQPVTIPSGVEVKVENGTVTVKGPKGELRQQVNPEMKITIADGLATVEPPNDDRFFRSLHGLIRTLIANMVEGVTQGFDKSLDMVGVGYKAQMKGKTLEVAAGYSHPVHVETPSGIDIEVPQPTRIVVKRADKQLVGQVAADIRKIRPPEPYKGKGIRYVDEHVRRKAGKAAK